MVPKAKTASMGEAVQFSITCGVLLRHELLQACYGYEVLLVVYTKLS